MPHNQNLLKLNPEMIKLYLFLKDIFFVINYYRRPWKQKFDRD